MRDSLDRVLHSFQSRDQPAVWLDARALIATERSSVEELLASSPETRIYGFTTLLGHLDSLDVETKEPDELLRAHLIGAIRDAPADFLRLVSVCKCEQLHHGGSGIHPDTYERVLSAALEHGSNAPGSWLASYGSGDVVPAAWWINSIFGASAGERLKQGDLIALLNGTFYSTALGMCASVAGIGLITEFLARTTLLCPLPPSSTGRATGFGSEALNSYNVHLIETGKADAQLPISLRDAAAYLNPAARVVSGLGSALDSRLGAPSANPLFALAKHGAVAESQSSFLDLNLTFALTNLIQYLHLSMGVMQRMIVHLCELRLARSATPDPRFVQPPKVAQALVERARLSAGQLPSHFSGSESNGIEDVRDLSLLTAETVLELVALATDVVGILDSVLESGAGTSGQSADVFRSDLVSLLVDRRGSDLSSVDATQLLEGFLPLSSPFLR